VLCIALPSLVLLFVPAFFLQVPGALLYPLPGRASPYSACALSGGLHAGLALCVVLPGFPCHVWCPVWAISDIQSVQTGWVSARVTVYLSINATTLPSAFLCCVCCAVLSCRCASAGACWWPTAVAGWGSPIMLCICILSGRLCAGLALCAVCAVCILSRVVP
jgi:hypothetical protein